ncbi:ribonuclease H-like domain-containing protein, partial [Tanacetum coccineum]
ETRLNDVATFLAAAAKENQKRGHVLSFLTMGRSKQLVDEQWFNLGADLFRKALDITPVDPAHPFKLPPTGDTVIDLLNQLGVGILCEQKNKIALVSFLCPVVFAVLGLVTYLVANLTLDTASYVEWLPSKLRLRGCNFPSITSGNPLMKTSRVSRQFGTMFGHKTANSWNLLIPGDPIGLFYSVRLGVCIPPRQGIIGGSLGPVFLLGLSAFAMVAACASRAAVKSAISCRRASKFWLVFSDVVLFECYGMIYEDGDNDAIAWKMMMKKVISIIVRTYAGSILICSDGIFYASSPLMAELYAICNACRLAVTYGWQNVVVESDSKVAISLACAQVDPPWSLFANVVDIKVRASQFGVNMVRSMWLFKHKFYADGTLSCYNARLVATGSSQQLGVDFDETFSPVVKPATIHTVLSLDVSRKWPIHQLDVKNAFFNDDLSETVYMHQPPSFVDARFPNHVCRLLRSLYGLKKAPRAWFQRFTGYATWAGFYHSRCHSSLFICRQGSQVAYLLIYVDDIILTASSPALLQQIIDSLHNEFDMTDLGALNYFLDISTDRNSTESKLGPESVHVQDPTLYRSLVEGLQYLTFTRPDLSYVVQQLYASATTSLVGYTDADWAGFPSTRRSTSSYCVFLGDNLLSWSAKRQHTISRSNVKVEYRGVANVVAETAWLRNLLRELHSPLSTATLVYCDNVSAVCCDI